MSYTYCKWSPGAANDCIDGQEISTTCNNPPMTPRLDDTYADCGRDDYWAPNPTVGSWLCSHYNIATDSMYYTRRAPRPEGCEA